MQQFRSEEAICLGMGGEREQFRDSRQLNTIRRPRKLGDHGRHGEFKFALQILPHSDAIIHECQRESGPQAKAETKH